MTFVVVPILNVTATLMEYVPGANPVTCNVPHALPVVVPVAEPPSPPPTGIATNWTVEVVHPASAVTVPFPEIFPTAVDG
jgi:hypothetical protein